MRLTFFYFVTFVNSSEIKSVTIIIYICNMEVKDRIRMVIDSHKLNAGAFADKIGVQRSNVSHVLSGRNKPSFEFIEKLLTAFPRVSAQWLLTGKHVPTGVELTAGQEEVTKSSMKEPIKVQAEENNLTDKKVIKTIVFYADFTFDVFMPNAQ